MCRLGEIKHLAARQTEPSLKAFTPAESLMRVHSVRTGLHNLRLRETKGCAQIHASVCTILYKQPQDRPSFFSFCFVPGGGGWLWVTLTCNVHSQSTARLLETQWVTVVCTSGHISQAGMLRQQQSWS